jgi:CxxC motif-containing protein
MLKKLICIECPVGCLLEVNEEGGQVVSVTGNKCDKGIAYGKQEIEDPRRVLTTTVLAEGLDLKLVPVRTDRPIPKARLLEAMAVIAGVRLTRPVKVGDTVLQDLLNLGADLIVTREAN